MGLESASWIDDLVTTNPPGTDQRKQGDDHLRLIKTVLKACFPRAAKAFRFPSTVAKSANYTVLSSDDNMTIVCDTTAAFTLTLPSLVAGDAGWSIYVLKTTTDANPVYIAPPSGTINGYTKVRRSIQNVLTKVVWTGSIFVAERGSGAPPIGSLIEFYGTTLPNGFLWPDGATFTAADFVELNTALGGNTKPDRRGKIGAGKTDMGVGDAGGITTAVSGIDGLTLKATGGAQSVTLARANLPNDRLALTNGTEGSTSSASVSGAVVPGNPVGTSVSTTGGGATVYVTTNFSAGTATLSGLTGSMNGNVTQTVVNKMPPTIIANYVLVAE